MIDEGPIGTEDSGGVPKSKTSGPFQYWVTILVVCIGVGVGAWVLGTIQFVGLFAGDLVFVGGVFGTALLVAFAFSRRPYSPRRGP